MAQPVVRHGPRFRGHATGPLRLRACRSSICQADRPYWESWTAALEHLLDDLPFAYLPPSFP